MNDLVTEVTRRRLPQFSLLTALLVTTVIAMAFTIALLWREVRPLRADNKRFNEERGTLVVGNSSKLHAIKIPARFAGEDRDSFRIYVPPGQLYFAYVQVNNIPKEGLPPHTKLPAHAGILGLFQGHLFARLEPGEHVVTIRTIHRGNYSDIRLGTGGGDSPLEVSASTAKEHWPTVVPETYSIYGNGVDGTTVGSEDSEPLVLLRRRIEETSRDTEHVQTFIIPEPDYPLDGVMLWVEPVSK